MLASVPARERLPLLPGAGRGRRCDGHPLPRGPLRAEVLGWEGWANGTCDFTLRPEGSTFGLVARCSLRLQF